MQFRLLAQGLIFFISLSLIAADRKQSLDLAANEMLDGNLIELNSYCYENDMANKFSVSLSYVTDINSVLGLADAITKNSSVNRLFLQKNRLKDSDITILVKAFKANSTINWLDLCFNDFGDEGAKALADLISKKPTLLCLYLHRTSISDEGAWSLADALMMNTNVVTCMLDYNRTSPKGKEAKKIIEKACDFNRNYYSETIPQSIDIVMCLLHFHAPEIECLPEDILNLLWHNFVMVKKAIYIEDPSTTQYLPNV